MAHIAYLGIGANLVPEPYSSLYKALENAVDRLAQSCTLIARSKWYQSSAVPVSDQPDFLNAVLKIETSLTAHQLLAELNQLEAEFGRIRTVRNAPRVLDIDILFFDHQIINDHELRVPHPRLEQRAFVLMPLLDINASLMHPVHQKTIAQLYDEFMNSEQGSQICIRLKDVDLS